MYITLRQATLPFKGRCVDCHKPTVSSCTSCARHSCLGCYKLLLLKATLEAEFVGGGYNEPYHTWERHIVPCIIFCSLCGEKGPFLEKRLFRFFQEKPFLRFFREKRGLFQKRRLFMYGEASTLLLLYLYGKGAQIVPTLYVC